MKKLLMIVALVGIVLIGYSKNNDSATDAQAQKPTITLSVSGDGFFKTITLHASQLVPESVYCSGQYQAPSSTTGYWGIALGPGETSATVSCDITEDHLVSLDKLSVGGQTHNLEIEGSGPYETASGIYYAY